MWAWILAALWLSLIPGGALAREKGVARATPPPNQEAELTFAGKFFCSLKRPVVLPFKGVITALQVRSGQRVEGGEVLARYRLAPEATLQLRQRLAPPQIKELELKLAEVEKNLASLEGKQREVAQLSQQKLAPLKSKNQIDREVQLLARQRAAVQERLKQERQNAQDDLAFLKTQLGDSLQPGRVPREADLLAPVGGHIIWVHPELREGGELTPGTPVFQVGVMDPMLLRAQAYETEALQLTLGDAAEVTLESLPGRKFEAKVSRISWAPITPGLDQPSYYEVELNVPNPDLTLKEGLKGRMVFRKSR